MRDGRRRRWRSGGPGIRLGRSRARKQESHGNQSAPPPAFDTSNAPPLAARIGRGALLAVAAAALAAAACDSAAEPAAPPQPAQQADAQPDVRGGNAVPPQPEADSAAPAESALRSAIPVLLAEAEALEYNGFRDAAAEMRSRALADPAFAALPPGQRYAALLDQIKLWLDLGRAGEAQALLSDLSWDLEVMPADAARRHALLRARAFEAADDLVTAVSSLDRYIAEGGPASPSILLIRARWQLELGSAEQAQASAAQALSYAVLPEDERLEALSISAEALEQLGSGAEAIDRLADLLAASPSADVTARALSRIGAIQAEAGNLSGAIAAWLQLVQDLPASPEAPEALQLLRNAGADVPLIVAGRVLYAAGEYDEARAELIDAIVFGTSTEEAEAEFLIARIAQAREEFDAAYPGFIAVVGRDSDSPFAGEALWRAADLYSEQDEAAPADVLYERVMREYPDYIWAADAALRWALWRADQIGWDAAAARLAEGASLASGWTVNERQRHLLWQGIAESRLGREADAAVFWERAAELGAGAYYGIRAAALLDRDPAAFAGEADAGAWLAARTDSVDAEMQPDQSTRWRAALDLRSAGFDGAAVSQLAQWRRDAGGNLRELHAMALHLARAGETAAALQATEQLLGAANTRWWQAPPAIARLAHPRPWPELLGSAAQQYELDERLLTALIRAESRFDPNARGRAGEIGLTQVIPTTSALIAEALGEEHDHARLERPETALRYGAWFLGDLLAANDDRPQVALAAYNAGPGNAARWLGVAAGFDGRPDDLEAIEPDPFADDAFEAAIDFPTTRAYVRHIIENSAAYAALAAYEAAHTPAGG